MAALGLLIPGVWASASSRVDIRQSEGRYELLRNGKPYVIRGAGAPLRHLEALASAGANSTRTWGVGDDLREYLDRAHALGLTVTVGIWLKHEGEDGFSYDNTEQVAAQKARARDAVLRFKDHPALLMWGVGNETELAFDFVGRVDVYDHVNDVAAMVKELDPHHPTMTVVAELGDPDGEKADFLRERLPDVDVIGFNTYGGAVSLPRRAAQARLGKPIVVTEFGAAVDRRTSWAVAEEDSSSEFADYCLAVYFGAIEPAVRAGRCLGSYWFYWGGDDKDVPGWHSAYAPGGDRLGTFDAMTFAWSGRWPENRAPRLLHLAADRDLSKLTAGDRFIAQAVAVDADGDPLTYRWEVRPERVPPDQWGDHEPPSHEPLPGLVDAEVPDAAVVTVPDVPGPYRLYLRVEDGRGSVAAGNLPFLGTAEH